MLNSVHQVCRAVGLGDLGEDSLVGVAGVEVRLQCYQDKVDEDEMRMLWRQQLRTLLSKCLAG